MHARKGQNPNQKKKAWFEFTYVANAPGDCALITRSRSLICLTLDAYSPLVSPPRRKLQKMLTKFHDVVSADRAVIHNDVPCPKGYSVPLRGVRPSSYYLSELQEAYFLHFEAWLLPVARARLARLLLLRHHWGILHLNVRHSG